MRLNYSGFQYSIIDQSYFNILLLESTEILVRFFRDLEAALNRELDDFSVFHSGQHPELHKIMKYVLDNWLLELNDRSLLRYMRDSINRKLVIENRASKITNKWYELTDLLEDSLIDEPRVFISDEDYDLAAILKAVNIAFKPLQKDYLKRLEEFLLIYADYSNFKIFLFKNLTMFLNENEMEEIVAFCQREEIYILTVEHILTTKIKQYHDRLLIVDNDNCELLF